MKLIFLHGPPASGKFTIARALQASHGVLNFHNHLTIDVAWGWSSPKGVGPGRLGGM